MGVQHQPMDRAISRRAFLRGAAAASGWVVLRPAPAGASGPVVTIDAPRDGTEASTAILEQIAAAPDGSTIRFPAGRYRVDRPLVVSGRRGLRIEGPGPDEPAVFYATTPTPQQLVDVVVDGTWPHGYPRQGHRSSRKHWSFQNCSDVEVRHLRVEGTNVTPDQRDGYGAYAPPFEAEHAFETRACQDVLIEDCLADAVWGDGLYLGQGTERGASRGVVVRRLRVDRTGRQGIALAGVIGCLIEDTDILHARRSGFDLEPTGEWWVVRDVEIRGCFTRQLHVAFAAMGRGDVSGIHIHHCRTAAGGRVVASGLEHHQRTGHRRADWRIEDNQFGMHGSPLASIRVADTDDVRIERNVAPVSPHQSRRAASLSGHGLLLVRDNDFRSACSIEVRGQSPKTTVVVEGNLLAPDCPGVEEAPSSGGTTTTSSPVPTEESPSSSSVPPPEITSTTSAPPSGDGSSTTTTTTPTTSTTSSTRPPEGITSTTVGSPTGPGSPAAPSGSEPRAVSGGTHRPPGESTPPPTSTTIARQSSRSTPSAAGGASRGGRRGSSGAARSAAGTLGEADGGRVSGEGSRRWPWWGEPPPCSVSPAGWPRRGRPVDPPGRRALRPGPPGRPAEATRSGSNRCGVRLRRGGSRDRRRPHAPRSLGSRGGVIPRRRSAGRSASAGSSDDVRPRATSTMARITSPGRARAAAAAKVRSSPATREA